MLTERFRLFSSMLVYQSTKTGQITQLQGRFAAQPDILHTMHVIDHRAVVALRARILIA
jgi:hypothetical protein